MSMRYLKVAFVALLGLQGLFYALGNLANWDTGAATVGHILSTEGNEVYSTPILPALTSSMLAVIAFVAIILTELCIGVLGAKGAWDLWRLRQAPAAEFNAGKKTAQLCAGLTVLLWFGGFVVLGGALFQMWQSQIGAGSFRDAAVFASFGALILLILNQPDD